MKIYLEDGVLYFSYVYVGLIWIKPKQEDLTGIHGGLESRAKKMLGALLDGSFLLWYTECMCMAKYIRITLILIIIIRLRYSELCPKFVCRLFKRHQCDGFCYWDAMSAVRCNQFIKYNLPQIQASNGSTEMVTTSSYSAVVTSTCTCDPWHFRFCQCDIVFVVFVIE
jgi:hypothetical protein